LRVGAAVGLRVGAAVGLRVGAAVVGWAVQGAAVVGLGVAERQQQNAQSSTQGSVAHQTKLARVNRYCNLKSTD
jgi:hypothetical protein